MNIVDIIKKRDENNEIIKKINDNLWEVKEFYDKKKEYIKLHYFRTRNNGLEGKYIKYSYSGKKDLECNYKNNELHGDYKKWNLGYLDLHFLYENGKMIKNYLWDL